MSLMTGIVIFRWYFPPVRPKELLREEKGWLTDVGHNSWLHIKCAQHAAHNPKFERWNYSDILSDGHKRIKAPTDMVEGGYPTLKKASNPTYVYCVGTNYSRKKLGQYHCYWGPGMLHHQVISRHDIIHVRQVYSYFPWGRILTP